MSALVEIHRLYVPVSEQPAHASEPTLSEEIADVYAPVRLFASSRVEVVEEMTFRTLFAIGTAVFAYGLANVL